MSKLFDLDIDIIDKKKFKSLYPIAKNKDVLAVYIFQMMVKQILKF